MSILHLVRTSAYQSNELMQCLQVFNDDDALVLIDDGCYNIKHALLSTFNENNLYFIHKHIQARAINSTLTNSAISFSELNTLIFKYHSVITWQ